MDASGAEDIDSAGGEPDIPQEGERRGRFLVLRDHDGCLHAVAAGSIAALCELDEGTLLMLPAGRLLKVSRPLATVLRWLDGR